MITVENVSKAYGKQQSVRNVSFHCRPGRITGFLGPNGAGKSTTMRIIAGLTTATQGHSTVAGHRYAQLPNPGRVIGLLLDASAMAKGLTGRQTLWLAAKTVGVSTTEVDRYLEKVGLNGPAGNRRVGDYSLGMRQRLGIALALIGRPTALMLDEPANGLDPAGILWMRSLLREFADNGGTVLLSSHLLHEMEQISDDLVVIDNGSIVARGSCAELLSTGTLNVACSDPATLAAELIAAGSKVERLGDNRILVTASAAQVGDLALASGIAIYHLSSATAGSLEDLFMNLTSGGE
ncbi:ABC transporter ATP-binding protein [Paenarthrobacter nitroguajacolicus]|uniref:ABC transporter ATP-binding protein n=1 Tax=Paenarthrobacter nitroguajacolicus TaxID=211146 RepID=UPI003AE048F1